MPTDKPRLNITFDPYTYAIIERLSELGGQPKGRIVSDLIEEMRPLLESMVLAAEQFQTANAEAQAAQIATLEEAAAKLMPDARRLQAQALGAFKRPGGRA